MGLWGLSAKQQRKHSVMFLEVCVYQTVRFMRIHAQHTLTQDTTDKDGAVAMREPE